MIAGKHALMKRHEKARIKMRAFSCRHIPRRNRDFKSPRTGFRTTRTGAPAACSRIQTGRLMGTAPDDSGHTPPNMHPARAVPTLRLPATLSHAIRSLAKTAICRPETPLTGRVQPHRPNRRTTHSFRRNTPFPASSRKSRPSPPTALFTTYPDTQSHVRPAADEYTAIRHHVCDIAPENNRCRP